MSVISTDTNQTVIEQAIEGELPISFRYWSEEYNRSISRDNTDREPPPRRVVSPYEFKDGKDGKTLLVCWAHSAERVRYFDIERIGGVRSEAELEEYVRPVSA